ncbi:hypothetical protein ACRAWG_12640 [Methylobacterium sp. P31]
MSGPVYSPIFTPQNQPQAVVPYDVSGNPLDGPFTSAVTLTPGTPVAPGRGVFITGAGTVKLKLSGGGFVAMSDQTVGAPGTLISGLAVVDADISQAPGVVVQILY